MDLTCVANAPTPPCANLESSLTFEFASPHFSIFNIETCCLCLARSFNLAESDVTGISFTGYANQFEIPDQTTTCDPGTFWIGNIASQLNLDPSYPFTGIGTRYTNVYPQSAVQTVPNRIGFALPVIETQSHWLRPPRD
jgi:hypothetical protein